MCYPAKLTKENLLNTSRDIHCLGIDEAILANLAVALKHQGHGITMSAESSLEPHIADKLAQNHIFSSKKGLDVNNIHSHLGGLIVGRKIDAKNIEVERAYKLGIPVYTYAEYIYQYAADKQRIVITGIEDRTAILLAIVMYVLRYWNQPFDHVSTSSHLDNPIKMSGAPIILIQADGHVTSTFNQQPQFLAYNPHIAVIDSLDKTFSEDEYTEDKSIYALTKLADSLPKAGSLIYNAVIPAIRKIGERERIDIKSIPYRAHIARTNSRKTYLIIPHGEVLITNPNEMTLEAIAGAYALLKEVAVTEAQFYQALSSFPNL